jgi:hypothetical protein
MCCPADEAAAPRVPVTSEALVPERVWNVRMLHWYTRPWFDPLQVRHTPVIPALGRLRQVDGKFEDSLGYIASSRLAWGI